MDATRVWLEVRDFGKGIDAGLLEQFQSTGLGAGIGLAGMRERMYELGGTLLEVELDRSGTLLRAIIPLPTPEVPSMKNASRNQYP